MDGWLNKVFGLWFISCKFGFIHLNWNLLINYFITNIQIISKKKTWKFGKKKSLFV